MPRKSFAKSPSAAPRGRRFPITRATATRAAVAAGWTTTAIAILAGLVWGVPALSRYAEATQVAATPERPVTVLFRPLPAWLPSVELERLELIVSESVTSSALDRSGLVAAREALLLTGWFDAIPQVRRLAPDRIEVRGDFTEPFAVVRDRSGDHLVDPEGRLLPVTWPHGEGPALPLIVGAANERPRRLGEPWAGADVAAALRVLQLLDNRVWATQVLGVDLGGRGRTDGLRLLTDRHGAIRWGRAPGGEGSAEPTANAKIAFLDHHHRHYGHIDGGLEGELDISGDVAVLR